MLARPMPSSAVWTARSSKSTAVPSSCALSAGRIYEKSLSFLPGEDYMRTMRKYEDSLNGFRQAIFLAQKEHMEGLREDFAELDQEMAQTKARLTEERRQLESGIQLDLNIEGKRRQEARVDLERRIAETATYEEAKMTELKAGLEQISLQAKAAIAGRPPYCHALVTFCSVWCYGPYRSLALPLVKVKL